MTLIGLLILLLLLGLLFWGARAIMAATGTPEPIRTIVMVFLVIVAVVAILNAFGYGGNVLNLRLTN